MWDWLRAGTRPRTQVSLCGGREGREEIGDPGPGVSGGPMPKLADRKLCADQECSHPISMAVALQDYVAPDCRFLNIHQGQVVYVFSKLKGRGRLFWGGSVQGDYYGDAAARLGYFPSSIVREDQTLKPATVDVKTDKWDFYCQ
nr:melanoma-derived growth regulatory protein isoform X1 [Saimiri boliviensis boliviensis]XP_039321835.1 melanoma-derived growth regulatory protein isoform X1 [Saimiri boliviensis boliviensis]